MIDFTEGTWERYLKEVVDWIWFPIYPLFGVGVGFLQNQISWSWTQEVLVISRGEKRVKHSSKNHRKDFKENTTQVHLYLIFLIVYNYSFIFYDPCKSFFAQTTKNETLDTKNNL